MSDTQTAPAPLNGEGWVVMYHPDLDGPDGHVYSEQPLAAYEQVWQAKGWLKVEPEDRLAGRNKAELQEEARNRGLDDSGTVAELRERLTGGGS